MEQEQLRRIIESALMAYGQPLTVEKLQSLFANDEIDLASDQQSLPSKENVLAALDAIQQTCEERGFELKKVGSGWRFQVRAEMAPWVNKLWDEKPQKYSRALLETLSIIAYRQPITRGDIEEIRGVAVSSHIIKTLTEREWIKVIGHRDVPGRPSLFATTRQFLDYFNLENLDELPSLRELADIDSLTPELDLQTQGSEIEGSDTVDNDVNTVSDVEEGSATDSSVKNSSVINDSLESNSEQALSNEAAVEVEELKESTEVENIDTLRSE